MKLFLKLKLTLISSNWRIIFRDNIKKRVRTSHIKIHTYFWNARYIFSNLYDMRHVFLVLVDYGYIYIIEIQTVGRLQFSWRFSSLTMLLLTSWLMLLSSDALNVCYSIHHIYHFEITIIDLLFKKLEIGINKRMINTIS